MDNGLSRRAWFAVAGTSAAAMLVSCGSPKSTTTAGTLRPTITDASAAIKRLEEGNQRFVRAQLQHPAQDLGSRRRLVRSQQPFAVILTCSDSRVPPELVFDQGLGDLFAVRVAGNIIDAAVLGSIEYAVRQLSTPLIMVMGHQGCGAVSTTLESILHNTTPHDDIGRLVNAIAPAVAVARQRPGDLLDNTVRANAEQSRDAIVQSAEFKERLDSGALKVIATYYSLETGAATML
jgi:carbonic anhydrase